jgi:hypothetical protein
MRVILQIPRGEKTTRRVTFDDKKENNDKKYDHMEGIT